jgi:hypothetical protein
MLDVDLIEKLKAAFRRSKWTKDKIKKLSQDDWLAKVLDVMDGRAEIRKIESPEEKILDTIIRVNHSVSPVYPSWMRKVLHKDLEFFGPSEYDISLAKEWYHPEQENGVIKGEVIYKYLKDNDMIKDQLGLADLLAIQAKGIAFFHKYFAGKTVSGWKSVIWSSHESFNVPYLVERRGEVILRWPWLGLDWDSRSPALRFADGTKLF